MMRLPRLQFTVRRLMLVVAIAGLVTGGGVWGYRMWELSGGYTGMAQQQWSDVHENLKELVGYGYGGREPDKLAELIAARAVYHSALAQKYERAARYPWFPIEPDLPEP
jgi:hypothetical protein